MPETMSEWYFGGRGAVMHCFIGGQPPLMRLICRVKNSLIRWGSEFRLVCATSGNSLASDFVLPLLKVSRYSPIRSSSKHHFRARYDN